MTWFLHANFVKGISMWLSGFYLLYWVGSTIENQLLVSKVTALNSTSYLYSQYKSQMQRCLTSSSGVRVQILLTETRRAKYGTDQLVTHWQTHIIPNICHIRSEIDLRSSERKLSKKAQKKIWGFKGISTPDLRDTGAIFSGHIWCDWWCPLPEPHSSFVIKMLRVYTHKVWRSKTLMAALCIIDQDNFRI